MSEEKNGEQKPVKLDREFINKQMDAKNKMLADKKIVKK